MWCGPITDLVPDAANAWYLIYTKSHQERVALLNLERQGYRAYLPLSRNRRRRAGRIVALVEPMFPRYLFINLDRENDDFGPIRSTVGIATFVRFGSNAAQVPQNLIALLRGREDAEGVQVLPQKQLQAGDRVMIVDGLLAGYEAMFEAKTSKERVMILLKVAGHSARVQVDADHIEPHR